MSGKNNFLGDGNQILTGEDGKSGAILNINTASDINIYNNSFIVKSSKDKDKPR